MHVALRIVVGAGLWPSKDAHALHPGPVSKLHYVAQAGGGGRGNLRV